MEGNLVFLSDDDSDDESRGHEENTKHVYKGLDASIVAWFCQRELHNLSQLYHCIVQREPSYGQTEELSIEEKRQKYSEDVRKCLQGINEKLKCTHKREYHYSKDEFDKVQEYFRKKSGDRDRQTELYIADTKSKVLVIGDKPDDVEKTLQELKIHLGQVKHSNCSKRQLDNNDAKTSNHRTTERQEIKTPTSPSSNQKFSYFDEKSGFHYEEKLAANLVLKVYSASITNLKVDVIVNAANDTLVHGGGVALVIAKGAGRELNIESRQYIQNRGNLKVTENCVTTAGKLPYKGVIHAVGPQWYDYRDKVLCMDDVYDTVFNMLLRCDKNRYRSVGMTAISAGIYGVPKVLCADMYVKAAVDFSKTNKLYPKEIHFVDVDIEILKLVRNSVEKWKLGKDLDQRKNVPEFLKSGGHLRSLDVTEGQGYRGNHVPTSNRRNRSFQTQTSVENQSNMENENILFASSVVQVDNEKFRWGGTASVFLVGGAITVKIFKGEIAKVRNLDALVCGMDRSLNSYGLLADALKKAGGTSYEKGLTNLRMSVGRHQGKVNEVFVSDPGLLTVKNIMHLINDRVSVACRKELFTYREGIRAVLEKAKQKHFKTVALPMIGTGSIQKDGPKLQNCCTALLQAVCEFCEKENEPSITELHLINNSKEVCDALVSVFKRASEQSVKSLSNEDSPVMWGKSSTGNHAHIKRNSCTREDNREVNCMGATGSTYSTENIYDEIDTDEENIYDEIDTVQEDRDNDNSGDDNGDNHQLPKKADQPRKGNLTIYEN